MTPLDKKDSSADKTPEPASRRSTKLTRSSASKLLAEKHAPPTTKLVSLESAASWLTYSNRKLTRDDLFQNAIERQLILSLELIDPQPAFTIELDYVSHKELSQLINGARENSEPRFCKKEKSHNEPLPHALVVHDGPRESSKSRKIPFFMYIHDFQYLKNTVDLEIDLCAINALKYQMRGQENIRNDPKHPENGLIVSQNKKMFVLANHPSADHWPPHQIKTFPIGARLVVRKKNLLAFDKYLPAPVQVIQQHPETTNRSVPDFINPNTVRREAGKLKTAQRHMRWETENKKLKKEHPGRTELWRADKISKMACAENRAPGTIKKQLS